MILINEFFDTLQGEATWAGTVATFIRTQGCPVGCPWCDTKHTWPASDRKKVSIDEMLAKVDSSPTWAAMDVHDIVQAVTGRRPRHFVITGGEPCAQDIYELTVQLGRMGRVQIETSGTYPIKVATDAWVTVSPKIDMPGGLDVLHESMIRANEIKMPVVDEEDVAKLEALLDDSNADAQVWLQPVSTDHASTELCIRECMKRGDWRLSVQTHKFASIR